MSFLFSRAFYCPFFFSGILTIPFCLISHLSHFYTKHFLFPFFLRNPFLSLLFIEHFFSSKLFCEILFMAFFSDNSISVFLEIVFSLCIFFFGHLPFFFISRVYFYFHFILFISEKYFYLLSYISVFQNSTSFKFLNRFLDKISRNQYNIKIL